MKLMTMKQYSKMTKASLVRKIMKALKKMPKTKLAKLCYDLEKSRLPTISTTKKGMPRLTARPAYTRRMPRSESMTASAKPKLTYDKKSDKFDFKRRTKKPRSAKQRANDKRLSLMAKRRAKAKRRYSDITGGAGR